MFKLYDFCFVTDDNATVVSVKTWAIVVAHYPQMPTPEKTGTIVVAHYPQMLPSENNGDITGS
jgi:hypothetical protein